MAASKSTETKPRTRKTAAEKAAEHERDGNEAIDRGLDGGESDRRSAGAYDEGNDGRPVRPEDVQKTAAEPHPKPDDPELLHKDERDHITPNVVTTDPGAQPRPGASMNLPSPDANGLGVDVNVTADGMGDRVPPVTVDGRPLPVDHRGVPITPEGTLEPTDEDHAQAMEDHAGTLTGGEHHSAKLLREGARRLRNRKQ